MTRGVNPTVCPHCRYQNGGLFVVCPSCSMDLRAHETALRARQEALQDALMPVDDYRPARDPHAPVRLSCGCEGCCVQETDGDTQWWEWRWTQECDRHSAAIAEDVRG